MRYEIIPTRSFKISVKKLLKRFPHVKDDVKEAGKFLQENPQHGDVIPGGSGARKLRVKSSDLTKGKSGGFRLLYYLEDIPSQKIYLLFLYVKSDREDITQKELKALLDELSRLR